MGGNKMNMRILIILGVIPFFIGVSAQAGPFDTQALPGTQPQSTLGAPQQLPTAPQPSTTPQPAQPKTPSAVVPQQIPRGTNIIQLPDLVPAHGSVSGGPGANGVCKSPVHIQLGAKNTKPYPVTTSFFIKLYHVGVLVQQWQVQGLEGNTERLFDYSYATTCQPMPSTPNFKLVIDPDNAVKEVDKNNNVMEIKMTPP